VRFLFLLSFALADMPKPGLIILCETGGVSPNQSHIASGYHCVLHDKAGASSAGAISIYDDTQAVP
jgi:hypothetical protein